MLLSRAGELLLPGTPSLSLDSSSGDELDSEKHGAEQVFLSVSASSQAGGRAESSTIESTARTTNNEEQNGNAINFS
jgi:hypothetical protein